jgi:solute carrier family 35 protein E3
MPLLLPPQVFSVYGYQFVTTLTLIHTLFTWLGMNILAKVGFFTSKPFTPVSVAPLAFGYVGYIILNNLSLNLNTVGFYQILKVRAAAQLVHEAIQER